MPLHPDAKELIGLPKPEPRDWNVTQVRDAEHKTIPLGGDPVAVAAVAKIEIEGNPELKLTHYTPLEKKEGAPLIWFPGGGFVCPPTAFDRPMRRLCREFSRDVYLAHYRLAPEHPFPAQSEDAPVLLRRAIEHQGGTMTAHIGGDSSGGNIAASLVLHVEPELRCQIVSTCLVYPMLDASRSQPSYRTYGEGFGFTAANPAGISRSGLPGEMFATHACHLFGRMTFQHSAHPLSHQQNAIPCATKPKHMPVA